LKLPLKKGQEPAVRPVDAGPLPGRMYIECTAACNISCTEACCSPETGITRTRQSGMLDFDLFRRVIDEVGPTIGRIDFFNYGEAFLHKRAIEMCEYIKANFPHIYLYTSTNGLAFSEEGARRLVHSGIDEVTFSIDGATQESYVQYRQRGKLDVALNNLRAMADEKRKAGRDLPFLNWRYILFKWNDSDEEMNQARRLASEIGVDRLCWEITDHPEGAFSRRFTPGSAAFEGIKRETWDDNNLGNAIPGATPSARIDVRTFLPGLPVIAPRRRSVNVRTRVRNLSTRAFPAHASFGRRLVRVGAQLCSAEGTLINLDFARADLPAHLAPGEATDVTVMLPAIATPGRYTLKFDLVNEGVDWFERCGSETTTRSLLVV
jgi:MoaA/NifB/PqqE/SkfB family radical SAM enzyme